MKFLERFEGVEFKLRISADSRKENTKDVSISDRLSIDTSMTMHRSIAIMLITVGFTLIGLFNLPSNPCVSKDLIPRM